MTAKESPRSRGTPNPFHALLVLTSTLFVVTCFGYLISPTVLEQARDREGAQALPSFRLAAWLDRAGPIVLGVEFLVMLVAGCLAMATDRWLSPPKPPKNDAPTRAK
ncbi:MAG: hypothetical protein AB7I30_11825 [Isosphaeraceae bacterium]